MLDRDRACADNVIQISLFWCSSAEEVRDEMARLRGGVELIAVRRRGHETDARKLWTKRQGSF
jgi:hypothetical protein